MSTPPHISISISIFIFILPGDVASSTATADVAPFNAPVWKKHWRSQSTAGVVWGRFFEVVFWLWEFGWIVWGFA